MADWIETFRGVVFPWNCDHYGHMNVRWYAHHFDDGGFHLWTLKGASQAALRARNVNVVVARITINYVRELKAGELFAILGGFVHIGNKSLRHFQWMFNADTGVLSATQDTIEVFFDPATRASAPMPADIRAALTAAVVPFDSEGKSPPPFALPQALR